MTGEPEGTPGMVVSVRTFGNEVEVRAPAHWRKKRAELLLLVFEVNFACPRCGNEMKIVSVLTESEPVNKILTHLKQNGIDARAGPFTGEYPAGTGSFEVDTL
jgi:hypothetical protein